jgi:secretion/DNA translocation related CpaE-like protein
VPRPLLLTADPDLLDDLLRLAATAGVDVEVGHEPGAARRAWSAAPLVVLGQDLLEACVAVGLPRRAGVAVLGDDLDDASIWRRGVEVGAEQVLFLPDAEPWLVAALADAAEGVAGSGRLVAVLGGRGGAGATTLSVALALSAVRRGCRALRVDGDPLGGGIDLVLGGEQVTGLRWPDLGDTQGRMPAQALREALPCVGGLSVLSWDRGDPAHVPAHVVASVLAAARRSADLVVVDLPRTIDDQAREVLGAADEVLLVVPAELRAAAGAARVASRASALCRDVGLVVRGPSPGGLTGEQIAGWLGLPLRGEVRAEPALEQALERGDAPGRQARSPLARLCARLLDDLLDPVQRQEAA